MSRAVVSWPLAVKPDAFLKVVLLMPSWRAFFVIMRPKFASLPPRCSATAAATSLADLVASAKMACSAAMLRPGLIPSLEGGFEAANFDIRMRVFLVIFPRSSASNIMYIVIILVSEAGYRFESARDAYNVLPVLASITIPAYLEFA